MTKSNEESGPVTISISRRVIPGKERDYEAWVQGITAEAIKFPGHMGVNVIRPKPPATEYVSIFRFDRYRHSLDWGDSSIRAQWLQRLDGITKGEDAVEKGTGLEFWFNFPELPVTHLSPHKMALVLLVVVFVLVLLVALVLDPITASWPTAARVFLSVFLQVTLMTYVVMLRLTRVLKGWLFDS